MKLLSRPTGVIPEIELADRLRIARRRTGLEGAQFADIVGLSRVTVSKYENGHVTPQLHNLRAWAEVTGVDFDWLETGKAPIREDDGPLCAPRDLNPEPAD